MERRKIASADTKYGEKTDNARITKAKRKT